MLHDFTCDGAWHRFTSESLTDPLGGPFAPGNTWVDARLTVYDPVHFDPLGQGHDANAVWLRPNVKITAVWPMVLGSDGNVTVTVDAVCRGPWAADSIGVRLNQGLNGLDAYGETYVGSPPVPCDGKLHRLQVVVEPLGDPPTVFRIRPTIRRPEHVDLGRGLDGRPDQLVQLGGAGEDRPRLSHGCGSAAS